jgi:hypothetical protein
MRCSEQLAIGRLAHSCAPHATPRLQSGGKRPPGGSDNTRYSRVHTRSLSPRKGKSLRDWLRYCGTAAVSMTFAAGIASAQSASTALPDLTGTYSCDGDDTLCSRTGKTFTVTQSGLNLEIKNERGEIGNGKLTSSTTISAGPTWNMSGVISAKDKRSLLWSNGTIWRKQ